jgi:hypothetical protein
MSWNDDGRLNFKKGQNFSKILKGIHDLQLSTELAGDLAALGLIGCRERKRTTGYPIATQSE